MSEGLPHGGDARRAAVATFPGRPEHHRPPPRRRDEGPAREEPAPKARNPLADPKVLVVGAAVLLLVLILLLLYWLHARQFEKTDDAFVDAHVVRLAPQAAGQVLLVLADDNALVEPGQVLVELDPSTARAALDQAVAQREEAAARVSQAQAQLAASEQTYRQAAAQIPGLAAQAKAAAGASWRLRSLQASTPRAVAAQQVDDAVAQARQTAAQRDAALRSADGAQAQAQAARTAIAAAEATVRAQDAAIAQNRISLSHAQVVAPIEGYVTQKSVASGNYVQPGDQLMAIVPTAVWVTANYKETQLEHMRVGQPVTMSVDACPVELHGKVLSIQRGSGQAFALLPPENATGNYVKVVQRVPVKIGFENVPRNCPLGPGLSVTPSVKVR